MGDWSDNIPYELREYTQPIEESEDAEEVTEE